MIYIKASKVTSKFNNVYRQMHDILIWSGQLKIYHPTKITGNSLFSDTLQAMMGPVVHHTPFQPFQNLDVSWNAVFLAHRYAKYFKHQAPGELAR